MVKTPTKSIAAAYIDGIDGWAWNLKVDPVGLYRWYTADNAPTGLRGVSRYQADAALRRFVADSFRARLTIIDWEND